MHAVSSQHIDKLRRFLPDDSNARQATTDEHVRFTLYVDALARVSSDTERELLLLIGEDPDVSMRDSAVITYVERKADQFAAADMFSSWLDELGETLGVFPVAHKRVSDLLLFKMIEETREPPGASLRAGEWLQRKLSEESRSLDVLAVLAEAGRTKRIRHAAARRGAELRNRP